MPATLNPSRVRLERFVAEAARSVPPGSVVLDAGCGDGLYRPLFSDHRYESADFGKIDKNYCDLTYVCELDSIPAEDRRFDMILLTQVLEHLSKPSDSLAELYRVLKPGCRLWLSAPLYYEEHEQPFDFFRYTQFGFRHLLESTGFEVERLEWLEGYFGTLSYQLDLARRGLPRHPRCYGGGLVGGIAAVTSAALRPAFGVLAGAFARLDLRAKYVQSGHCKNYAIVARRPD